MPCTSCQSYLHSRRHVRAIGCAETCRPPCAELWVNQWTQLLTDIVSDPPSAQRVMVDILNEPDA